MTLVDMSLAFVVNHPAVTAAIIGPRTMAQIESQLGAADVVLDDALLDRIDEIVAPGTTINPTDAGWTTPRAGTGGAAPLSEFPCRTASASVAATPRVVGRAEETFAKTGHVGRVSGRIREGDP